MTTPPRPIPARRPAPVPLSTQASKTPAEIALSGRKVSALTAGELEPEILTPRECILCVGDTVAGKTFSYYVMAEDELKLAQAEGRDPARFWIIDTDLSHPKFLADGYEFAHLSFTNGGNCYPMPARDMLQVRQAVRTILNRADPARGDWAIVDVVNRAYEHAQRKHAEHIGKDLDDEWADRITKGKGFGAFEPQDWNVVRRGFEAAIYRLIDTWPGNVLFLQHMKPIIMHFDGKSKRREMMTLFGPLGYKPDGAPNLITAIDTILTCWANREPDITGKLQAVRRFQILKDRGQIEMSPPLLYGRNLYQSFNEYRRTKQQPETVEDPAVAKEIEDRISAEMDEYISNNAAAAESSTGGSDD